MTSRFPAWNPQARLALVTESRIARSVGRELLALGQIGVEVDGSHHHSIEHPLRRRSSVRRRHRTRAGPGPTPPQVVRGPSAGSWMTWARRGAIVSTMPQPPALTPEQRQAALAKAAKVRRERAEVKEKLKLGSITLSELLTTADSNETVGKMKVLSVLESLPGLGQGQGPSADGHRGDQREPPAAGPGQQPARVPAPRDRSLNDAGSGSGRRSGPHPLTFVLFGPGGVGKGTIADGWWPSIPASG